MKEACPSWVQTNYDLGIAGAGLLAPPAVQLTLRAVATRVRAAC